jgi:alpha-tubulin suppressor-like RCC1 family protein
VTAVAEGTARIRAEVDRGVGFGVVVVSANLTPVDVVVVLPDSAAVIVGGRVELTAVLQDAAGGVLPYRQVTWATSDPAVATVSGTSGSAITVSGVAPGTATITATSEGKSGRAAITVVNAGSYAKVVGGNAFSCGLTTAGRVLCWGDNSFGNLGNGRTRSRDSVPVEVAGGRTFSDVAATGSHACALAVGGAAWCWGEREGGRLGNGQSVGMDPVPTEVTGGLTFSAITAGYDHTCALKSSGAAYCWGRSEFGGLGNGSNSGPELCGNTPCSTTPVAVFGGLSFIAISAGDYHTCALAISGAAYCWGPNDVGQLGTGSAVGPELCSGSSPCSTVPAAVAGGLTFIAIAAGYGHTCAVTPSADLYCWGGNHLGQLGVGTATGPQSPCSIGVSVPCSTTPMRIPGSLRWAAISAGLIHTCAITTSGAAYCWGANEGGSLGLGTGTGPDAGPQQCGPEGNRRPCSVSPRAVSGSLTFASITAGWQHTCGITLAGIAYCWGANDGGQLGNGRQANGSADYSSSVPVRVSGQP